MNGWPGPAGLVSDHLLTGDEVRNLPDGDYIIEDVVIATVEGRSVKRDIRYRVWWTSIDDIYTVTCNDTEPP